MKRTPRLSALLAAATAAIPALVHGQTPTATWTGTTSTSWTAGTWVTAPPSYGGSVATLPQFNNTSSTSYTATNNLGPFSLNGLYFNATSSGTILVNNAMGSSLRFVPNGIATPSIQLLSSTASTLSAPLRISSNLSLKGSGAGLLGMSGLISGSGSLTIDRNNGTIVFTAMSSYTGGTTVNSGTVQFNSATSLGSGTITVNGGAFRTINAAYFDSYNPIVTNAQFNFTTTNGRWTLYGPISGSAGVRNTGLGTLLLRGNNTYGGSTLIDALTATKVTEVTFFNDNNLGASTTPVIFHDATGGTAISALSYGGIGSVNLTHPIQIDAHSEARVTPNWTNSTLVLSGGISGTGDLNVGLYQHSGIVELAGSNTYSGETWVTTGTLRFDSDARFGNSNFIVLNGGCIMPRANWTPARSVSLGSNSATASSAINTAGFDITLAGGLDSSIAGLTDLIAFKSGAGSLKIGNIVGGALSINAGDVTLYDNGTMNFLSSVSGTISPVTVNRGGTLVLDNSGLNLGDRLQNAGTLSMNGGTLTMRGNAAAVSSETTGAVAMGTSSFNVIDLRSTGTGITLTAASLVNNGGAGALYRVTDLGNSSKIVFTAAPTLVGAGGASGTPDLSVLAGAFGDDTANGLGSGFVTHGANGVRLLTAAEYDSTIISGAATNTNVSLDSAVAGINSPTTINSLRLLNGASVSGTSTLSVSSSGILVPASATASIAVGTLSGTAIHLRNNGVLNLESKVNATTLNISGSGVTTVSNTLSLSGGLSIHEGTLRSAADQIIPDTTTLTVNEGATWDLNGRTETVAGLTQQNIVTLAAGSYGTVNVNGGVLTLSPGAATTVVYSGKLTGGGTIIKSGVGTIALNGQNNDFSGLVQIQQGMLRLNSISTAAGSQTSYAESRRDADADSVLACSGVEFNVNGTANAELKLSDQLINFSRPVTVNGNTTGTVRFTTRNATLISSNITLNRTLQIGAGGGTFSGMIQGPGSIMTVHPDPTDSAYLVDPVISMTGSNTYSGTTTVAGGTLLFTADVANGGPGQFGNATSAIVLGDTAAGTKGSELSGVTPGTTLSRAIVSGTGSSVINLSSRAGASGSVTFAGPITLNCTATLFSAVNPADSTVGTVAFTGAISGAAAATIGGSDDFTGQPRQRSNVVLASSLSSINGMTLSAGSLGIAASSVGVTGPLGSGVATIGISTSTTEVPTIYALNGPQSVHNNLVFNTHALFAGNQPLTFNGTVAIGSVERLFYVEGANVTFNGVLSGTGSVGKDGPGTLTLGSTNNYSGPTSAYDGTLVLGASQTPSSLNIGTTAKVIVSSGGNKILRTSSLNIVDGATLDLTDEDAILDYTAGSPLLSTRSRIIEGFNGGAWNGSGIRSSTAAGSSNPKTGLGYAEASMVLSPAGGVFSGASVDGTTVLIRYTALGDADLNGTVNSIDFGYLLAGYGLTSNALWNSGDFTYDGKVNTLDFNELAGNFGAVVAGSVAGSPTLGTVVPEPGTLAFAAVFSLLALRRMRNRPR